MSLKLVTPPEELPLTLDEVKAHLRVEGTDEDAYLTALIGAATDHAQNVTNRQLITAEYKLMVDNPGSSVAIPRPPFGDVVDMSATNKAGDILIFDADTFKVKGSDYVSIVGIPGSAWFESVYTEITYTAGYGTAEQVPNAIKQAMLLIIGHLYTNREEVVVGTINSFNSFASDALLSPYRIFNV